MKQSIKNLSLRGVGVLLAASCLSTLGAPSLRAQEMALQTGLDIGQTDQGSFRVVTETVITLRLDGSAQIRNTYRGTVLGEAAIAAMGAQTRAFTADNQSFEIEEAYTHKWDGRRIPVDLATVVPGDIAGTQPAMYQLNRKARTVIFPDLAVDDTVVLTTRVEQAHDAMNSGKFAYAQVFRRDMPYAEAKLTVIAPKQLAVKVGAFGGGLELQKSENADMVTYAVTYRPVPVLMREPGETSALDHDPRVLISTFSDNADLGAALGEATVARVKPTPTIAALAEEITRGIADRRGQAEAIDRWVKQNIRYIALYADVSEGYVAHAPEQTLKYRYGDCKDHVALMSALLAAKGIASEAVRIYLGDVYTMPEIATPAYQNHRIIYLPEFELFDDPTAGHVGFGVLAPGDYDKPVIRIGANGSRLDRTPPMRMQDHTAVTRTTINVAADRSMSGQTTELGTGIFAATLRASAARFQQNGLQRSAEAVLHTNGLAGKAHFDLRMPAETTASFELKSTFQLATRLSTEADAAPLIPVGLSTMRPGGFFFGTRYAGRKFPFMCYAGRQIQEIEINFAEGLPLPDPLKPTRIDTKVFTYTAEGRLEGRSLKIRRELASRVPGQVCAPEIEAAITEPLKGVEASLGTRLHFSPATTAALPVQQL